jgi:hypothetical protein
MWRDVAHSSLAEVQRFELTLIGLLAVDRYVVDWQSDDDVRITVVLGDADVHQTHEVRAAIDSFQDCQIGDVRVCIELAPSAAAEPAEPKGSNGWPG